MITISKERLQWLANISGRDDIDDIDGGEIRELALIALASLEAEPVAVNDDMAYAFHHALSDSSPGADEVEEIKAGLRAAFANVTTQPAPVVPEFETWFNSQESGRSICSTQIRRSLQEISWNACCAAMLQCVEPASNHEELSEENGASLQLRNLIRQRHAEWSDKTFGCVGPVGPLKHLSKEALEAAVEPDDLSEWADMQFLLWDAQRRAGISDAEITAAMEDKLKINMERQWPEPKDGEPRLHIKEPGNSPVIPDGLSTVCAEAYQVVGVMADALGVFGDAAVQKVLDNLSQQKLVHRDVLPFSLPVTPDSWISCSDRMPDDGQHVIILCDSAFVLYAQYRDGEFFDIVRNGDEFFETQSRNVTDWMPLPEPPQEVK